MTVWLEKGLDIFRFGESDPSDITTIESYLVVEEA
jgi:hypothetical protein